MTAATNHGHCPHVSWASDMMAQSAIQAMMIARTPEQPHRRVN